MTTTGKLEVDIEMKSNPDKFWTAVLEFDKLFPKAFPEKYKSIELLEGDGKSVIGSVYHIKYAEGPPLVTESREKIDAVDEVNKTMSYSVIDGKLTSFYKSFKGHVAVASKGEGSLAKLSFEYEKAKEDTPDPDFFKDFIANIFQDLDAYLLKA